MYNPSGPSYTPGDYYELKENYSYITPKGTKVRFVEEEFSTYEFAYYEQSGTMRIVKIHESDLSYYFHNSDYYKPKLCECGSDKVKHPSHSGWCPKYVK